MKKLIVVILATIAICITQGLSAHADDVKDSPADVVLSKGLRITDAPDFDFGTVFYEGTQKTTSTDTGKMGLSFYDGTPSKEYPEIYVSIPEVPQEGMKSATMNMLIDGPAAALPPESIYTKVIDRWYYYDSPQIKLDGTKTKVFSVLNRETSKTTYDKYKSTEKEFRLPWFYKKTMELPAGLQPFDGIIPVQWDILSVPYE